MHNRISPPYLIAGIAALLMCVPLLLWAEEPLPAADEIVSKLMARPEGETLVRTITMVLTDKRGKTLSRTSRLFRKYFGKERKSVMFFTEPRNVKDTAFLTWDYPDEGKDDDQWIYLPAARKVRRISAAKRGDYFMGTDLTYDDMKSEGKPGPGEYNHRILGIEEIEGHPCYKMVSIPVTDKIAKELGYSKVMQWVDPESFMTRRFLAWDIGGNELKTISFKDIKKVDGIWTAFRIEVDNHKTGHHTLFSFSDVDYNKPIEDRLFRVESLKRGL